MIRAYMKKNAVVHHGITKDDWGVGTPADTTRDAQIIYGSKLVMNLQGEKVVSAARVRLHPTESDGSDVAVSHEDKFTFDGETHIVLEIKKVQDFSVKFIEIAVQ